jgi:hypothetical protein
MPALAAAFRVSIFRSAPFLCCLRSVRHRGDTDAAWSRNISLDRRKSRAGRRAVHAPTANDRCIDLDLGLRRRSPGGRSAVCLLPLRGFQHEGVLARGGMGGGGGGTHCGPSCGGGRGGMSGGAGGGMCGLGDGMVGFEAGDPFLHVPRANCLEDRSKPAHRRTRTSPQCNDSR